MASGRGPRGGCRRRGRARRCFLADLPAVFRVGKNHQHICERRRRGVSPPADVKTGIVGPELVLELKISVVVENAGRVQSPQHFSHPGILLRTGLHLSAEGGSQAEGTHTLSGEGLLDPGDGEFEPSQRHVGTIELEIHQVAVRRREPADHNGAVEPPVAVAEKQPAMTGQLPDCDAALEVLDVGTDLLLAPLHTSTRPATARSVAGSLPALYSRV